MDRKIEIPDAYSVPLDQIHPAEPALFKNNVMWSYFERLRKEDPVHYCKRPFDMGMGEFPVSYTHLTLPTIYSV